MQGVVAKLAWVNPHAYIYVDAKDASGKITRYAFETSSPNALLRRGWKRDSLKEGDQVTVDGYLAKDPRPLTDGSLHGNARLVTLAGGKTVFAGSSADDGGPAQMSHWRFVSSLAAAAIVLAMLSLAPLRTIAQSAEKAAAKGDAKGKNLGGPGGVIAVNGVRDENLPTPPAGPTPHALDGKPNLSGVWLSGNYNFANMGGALPLQPWAQKLMEERQATQGREDPEAKCLPAGVPRITPYPFKIVQSPEVIVMLFEGNVHSFRQFLLNRAHDKDLDPSWMGDSIASWQGDTLVVDTVNFNDKTWLNGRGAPHTEKLHVIERYSRPDLGHLEAEITMEDPGAFTKPHTFKRTHVLSTTWEIHEYVCNEFNVDVDRLVGK